MENNWLTSIEQHFMVHNSANIDEWEEIREKFKTLIFHSRNQKKNYSGGLIYLSLYYFANYDDLSRNEKFAIYCDNEYSTKEVGEAHSQFTYVVYLSHQKLCMDRYFSSHKGNYEYMGTYNLLCTSDQNTYETVIEYENSDELMKWNEEHGWGSLESLSTTDRVDQIDGLKFLKKALLRKIDAENKKVNNIFDSLKRYIDSEGFELSYNNYEQELGKLFGQDMLYSMNGLKKSMSVLCSDYLYVPVKAKMHSVDEMTYYVMKSTQAYAITPYLVFGCNHVDQLDEMVVYDICESKEYLITNITSLM